MTREDISNQIQSGPVVRVTLRLTIPVLLSMLLNTVYLNVDKYFVARIDLADAFYPAAIQAVFPFYFLVTGIGIIFQVGINSVLARAIGRRDVRSIRSSVLGVLIFMGAAALVLTAVCGLAPDSLLRAFGISGKTLSYAKQFHGFVVPSIPFIFFNCFATGVLLSFGDAKRVMIINGVSNVANIVLDPILIFGWKEIPGRGLAGASLATLISLALAAAMYARAVFQRQELRAGRGDAGGGGLRAVGETLTVGFSGAINPIIHSLVFVVVNYVISSIDERAFAPLSIVGTLAGFALIPCFAMYGAQITVVGQNYGANAHARTRRAALVNPILIFLFMTAIGVVLFAFAGPLVGMFSSDSFTLEQGKRFVRIESLTYGFVGVDLITRATLTGYGKKVMPILQILVRYLIFFLPSFYLFLRVTERDVASVFFSLALSNVLIGVFGAAYLAWWFTARVRSSPRAPEQEAMAEEATS